MFLIWTPFWCYLHKKLDLQTWTSYETPKVWPFVLDGKEGLLEFALMLLVCFFKQAKYSPLYLSNNHHASKYQIFTRGYPSFLDSLISSSAGTVWSWFNIPNIPIQEGGHAALSIYTLASHPSGLSILQKNKVMQVPSLQPSPQSSLMVKERGVIPSGQQRTTHTASRHTDHWLMCLMSTQ